MNPYMNPALRQMAEMASPLRANLRKYRSRIEKLTRRHVWRERVRMACAEPGSRRGTAPFSPIEGAASRAPLPPRSTRPTTNPKKVRRQKRRAELIHRAALNDPAAIQKVMRQAMHTVREHPILFKAEMVRAILDGRKTVTRRIVTERNSDVSASIWTRLVWSADELPVGWKPAFADNGWIHVPCRPHEDDPNDVGFWTMQRLYPKYEVGDHLWVRETLHQEFTTADRDTPSGCIAVYSADGTVVCRDGDDRAAEFTWQRNPLPSIHMPRWASRITLGVTGVRAERLQEITEDEARAEGVESRDQFFSLWDRINAKRGDSVESNPLVWVIDFRMVESC